MRLGAEGFQELATGGWTSSQLLTAIQGSSIPAAVRHSMIVIGVNDILGDVVLATVEANLTAIAAALPDPHFATVPAFGNHASWTSGRETNRKALNTWIKANLPHVTDLETILGDGNGTQARLLAGFDSGDGLHWNEAGDRRAAESMFESSFGNVRLLI